MSGEIGALPTYTVTEVNHRDLTIAQQLHTVQFAAYQVESMLIHYPNLPPLFESVEDIQRSREHFLACWCDGKVAGVLSFERHGDEVEICRLVVAPEVARRGVGSHLLIALEQREVDCRLFWVSTAELNIPAIRLYEKQGYQIRNQRMLPDGLRLVELEKEGESL